MRVIFYIFLSILAFQNSVFASSHEALSNEEIVRQIEERSFKRFAPILEETRIKAEKGDARSQMMLGMAYSDGIMAPLDYKEAYKWFALSAEQGMPEAQETLAGLYVQGRGVNKDLKEAARLFELAANQGKTRSQFNLGFAYAGGYGVPKDYVKSYKWLKIASMRDKNVAKKN